MIPGPQNRRLFAMTLAGLGLLGSALVAAPSAGQPVADRALALPAAPAAIPWRPCGGGFECADVAVPKDYDQPGLGTLTVAVIRLPARNQERRIGPLFVNFGGPGGPAVSSLRAFGADFFGPLNSRFDIVGIDPRGVGKSRPAIDCAVNQERIGVYRQPFPRPGTATPAELTSKADRYIDRCLDRNEDVLEYVSTANVARDMDLVRGRMGDPKLSYLGFSYGTFLGATYASLFPDRYRAMVLDGALDPDQYINEPLSSLAEQTAGFELGFGRFMQACARNQKACQDFGGDDPWAAYDTLARRLDRNPVRVGGRAYDGDDLRAGTALGLYSKSLWPLLAQGLKTVRKTPRRSFMPLLTAAFYGRNEDGTYSPSLDRYFTLGALEQRYPTDIEPYLREGRESFFSNPHFWWNNGYVEYAWGRYPVPPRDVFYGPFDASSTATPPLFVGTTFDPATPYQGAKAMVRQLGNARLLTMVGDGHTAYGGNSRCIDRRVNAYLLERQLPRPGKRCQQRVPFTDVFAKASRVAPSTIAGVRPHQKPMVG